MQRTAFLRAGLAWKLAGANLLIALAAIAAVASGDRFREYGMPTMLIVMATIAGALAVNFVLVRVALGPLHDLELTVQRVVEGDFHARVPPSAVADAELARVGSLVNALLDTVSTDRLHMRQMASRVIHASERQRAAVAHELHESTAQTLAAVMMQVGVAVREESNPIRAARLSALHDSLGELAEEVRLLAQGIHSRVLEDLGLAAALRELVREARRSSDALITLEESGDASRIPVPVSSALFRVAEEALMNAVRHANPGHIGVHLSVDVLDGGHARLEVIDDGSGFDLHESNHSGDRAGLFAMRQRLALVNGTCVVRSVRGQGTQVLARVPLVQNDNPEGRAT